MRPFFHELFNLAVLRSGRRVSLYHQWQPFIAHHGLTAVQAHLARAIAHDQHTRELENRWAASTSKRKYRQDMRELDSLVDRMLAALVKFMHAQTIGLSSSDPLAVAAAELETALFPAGVYAITSLPFVEQAVAAQVIVAQLQGPFVVQVTDLGLQPLTDRLAAAVDEYRLAVDAGNGEVLYSEVQAAHQRGLEYLAEILCMIMAHFHDADNPAHMAARAPIFELLRQHDQQARADHRARRARRATGEEELPEEALREEMLREEVLREEMLREEVLSEEMLPEEASPTAMAG